MRKFKIILFLVLTIVFCSTCISNSHNNFPLLNRVDKSKINYLYNIQLKKIIEESEFFKAQINYPYLQIKEKYKGMEKENTKTINIINNEIYNYLCNFKSNIKKQSKQYEKEYKNSYKDLDLPKFVYEAYSEYDVSYNRNNLISIPILTYEFTGGAHGISTLKSFNYNLKSGEELKLSNIFKYNVDYKSVINNYIKQEIEENKDLYFTGKDGFKGIDDDQGFYLENDKLIIYFQLYEISPYYIGIPKFEIPFSEIKNLINL